MRTTNTLFKLLMLGVSIVDLSCSKDNCTQSYQPGDKFRVTINESEPGDTPCDLFPLHPGDSFELAVGDDSTWNDGNSGCRGYAATSQVPSFATGILSSCGPGGYLGQTCSGQLTNGCGVNYRSEIDLGSGGLGQTVEHAKFSYMLSSYVEDWGELDGGACLPNDCAWDQYDVRIDRL
jgi:hypothetical protein